LREEQIAMTVPGDTRTWRAPGRVNLIGEHTDYNDGFALPLAIAQGCTAIVTVRADTTLHVRSAQAGVPVSVALADLRPDAVEGWAAYVAGVIWALVGQGVDVPGLDVAVDGDVPLGSGLSSSAALSCSAASAVNDLLGLGLSSAELVGLARACENDFVGAPTGGMDQLASIRSEAGHVLLCDMHSLDTRAIPMNLAAAGLTLLVTDTQAPHQHADGEYRARRAACERAAGLLGVGSLREVQDDGHLDVLGRLRAAATDIAAPDIAALDVDVLVRRTRHVLTENDRVLAVVARLSAGEVAGIGPLLTASHNSMRDDFEITVPEVDTAVTAALAAGALGARMTGGGFGGCVISLTPTDLVADVTSGIASAFADNRFTPPTSFTATPSRGAHRL
jgi:galactokinase